MLGNQLVKVQSLSQIQQQQIQKVANLNSSNALTSNTATMTGSNTLVLQSGQTIKVQQPNQTGIRPQQIILGPAALKVSFSSKFQITENLFISFITEHAERKHTSWTTDWPKDDAHHRGNSAWPDRSTHGSTNYRSSQLSRKYTKY